MSSENPSDFRFANSEYVQNSLFVPMDLKLNIWFVNGKFNNHISYYNLK